MSTSLAVGRCAGLSDKSDVRRAVPAFVRSGNFARITAPVVWEVFGRRSERALGRRLKPGHVASVGIPQSSNIWNGQQGVELVTVLRMRHLCKLIHFILALQQRLLCQELAEYTPDTPQINLRTVLFCTEEQLWGTIPQRDD